MLVCAGPAPESQTASVRRAGSTKALWNPDRIDTFQHVPTNRHDLAEPYRSFVVTHNGYAVEVHNGAGLTLDRVIAWAVDCARNGDGSYPDYDEAVFEGRRLRAVFHTTFGRIGYSSVTRFDADGRAETENLVTTAGEFSGPPDAA
jgi:hypothetical protein